MPLSIFTRLSFADRLSERLWCIGKAPKTQLTQEQSIPRIDSPDSEGFFR